MYLNFQAQTVSMLIFSIHLGHLVTKLNIGRINISCLSLLKPIGEELPSTSCLPSLLDLDYPSTSKYSLF